MAVEWLLQTIMKGEKVDMKKMLKEMRSKDYGGMSTVEISIDYRSTSSRHSDEYAVCVRGPVRPSTMDQSGH